ncbi:MAG: hypothetical protein R3F19_10445 [Verrucomicrobiales bacterium]
MAYIKNRQIRKSIEFGAPLAFHFFTVLAVSIYYIGLAASIDMDYSARNVSQAAVLERALGRSLVSVLHEGHTRQYLWFIPFAALSGLCIQLLRTKQQSQWIRAVVFLVPPIIPGPIILPLAFCLPWFLVAPLDGETLAENWPVASAAGAWTLAAGILLTIRINGWPMSDRPTYED